MQTSLKVHQTVTVTKEDGTVISVHQLPEAVRNEIETLDRFKQKKMDIVQELEIIELAILAKTAQISRLVSPPASTEG